MTTPVVNSFERVEVSSHSLTFSPVGTGLTMWAPTVDCPRDGEADRAGSGLCEIHTVCAGESSSSTCLSALLIQIGFEASHTGQGVPQGLKALTRQAL